VGRIVIDMASGYGIPPWQAKTIAVMFYQHNDSVGTSNWALQILDKFRRLLPPRHPLRPQLRLQSLLLGSNSTCC
jgi:hypothetical protein